MGRPIVFLAGTMCNERVWESVISKLDSTNPVICKYLGSYPNWQQEIECLLEDLPDKFNLVGFSLGGIASLAILSLLPERIEQLVLVSSTALSDPEASQSQRRALLKKAENSGDMTELAMMQVSDIDKKNIGSEGRQLLLDMAGYLSVEQYACQTELACTRQDTRTALSESGIPTHLVFGSEDNACGEDKQMLIKEVCSTAETYKVAGAGHWLPVSHPETVARIISRIVDE
ncbi:alpha/beta fold hydrolase [Salinivibrio kushneri]|uniref:Alpha/beta hydrolase n=1 Tax=Salinivibrio kushneri TaxID=1908198 RepID=A0AA47KP16_9GAMM|nr:alpha/beta hydrolase [Salinivibrio kushneri]WBA10506.1 alpha/beta hydrolase [Salinivibrio kushneri]